MTAIEFLLLLRRRGGASILSVLQSISGYLVSWPLQETSGDVAEADNVAVALGRNIASQEYDDYTAGTGWSNPSGEIASCDGSQVTNTELTLSPVEVIEGATYQTTFTISNRTAGSVMFRVGNTNGTNRSADGTYVEDLVAGSTNSLRFRANSVFVGDIDLESATVKQTDILASSAYPGAELSPSADGFTFTGDDPDGWTVVGEVGADPEVSEVGSGESHGGVGTGSCNLYSSATSEPRIRAQLLTIGERFKVVVVFSAHDGSTTQIDIGGNATNVTAAGTYTIEEVASTTQVQFRINSAGGNVTIDSISIKEANPLNGDHTGVSVGQTGQYNVPIVVTDDGAITYTDFLSSEYNSIYDATVDFTKYSLMRKSTWDTTARYLFYDYVDANNYIAIYTSTTQDQVVFEFMAGGTLEQITWDSSGSTDLMLLDVGRDSGTFKARVNGVNVGSEAIAGTFAGNFTIMLGGANSTTPTSVHLGDRAYMGNYSEYVSDADMLSVVSSMGIPS